MVYRSGGRVVCVVCAGLTEHNPRRVDGKSLSFHAGQLIAVPQGIGPIHYVLVNDIVFDPNNPAIGIIGAPKIQCQFDGAGFAVTI